MHPIQSQVDFAATKWHTPIRFLVGDYAVREWLNQEGLMDSLAVIVPQTVHDIMDIRRTLARYGHNLLHALESKRLQYAERSLLVMVPMEGLNPYGDFQAELSPLIDRYLARMARRWRHSMRSRLVTAVLECATDRRRELEADIRENTYELERQTLCLMQLARKLEGDRAILDILRKPDDYIQHRTTHTFCDLVKLIPAAYMHFYVNEDSIYGTTVPISIEYEGYTYDFDTFTVEVNIRAGKIYITGGKPCNGYIHPHVSDEASNICWGNTGGMIQRLIGQVDLFSLYQLVYSFLTSYNASDPYQKIERWDPDYSEDDDEDNEPYCSYCDDYGHTISECESCWWCDHCEEYVDDHDPDTECPNHPRYCKNCGRVCDRPEDHDADCEHHPQPVEETHAENV